MASSSSLTSLHATDDIPEPSTCDVCGEISSGSVDGSNDAIGSADNNENNNNSNSGAPLARELSPLEDPSNYLNEDFFFDLLQDPGVTLDDGEKKDLEANDRVNRPKHKFPWN